MREVAAAATLTSERALSPLGMPVRWGFLGVGGMARTMAPVVAAARGATLRAVAAREQARARAVAGLFVAAATADETRAAGAVEPVGYGSYAELVEDPEIDAVYVALANDAHAAG